MKRILLTGAGGYIAASFREWMKSYGEYKIAAISVRNSKWKQEDFSGYDVLIHTAGIAHVDEGRTGSAYYEVNTDLTLELAGKAKAAGIGQFIFCSSMIVYGESRLGQETIIDSCTSPAPFGYYGDSKLKAEVGLKNLEEPGFAVTILRLPMVYGKNCKGNYRRLERLAGWIPVFPTYYNRRSMIEIRRLCRYIKQAVDQKTSGILHPQDEAYHGTADIMKALAVEKGRTIVFTGILNPVIALAGKKVRAVNKAFGSMVYSPEITWKLDAGETEKPLISIITVAYNSERTIRDTLESVLEQDYDRIEYIVVDGKSGDSTCRIAEEYREEFSRRGFVYKIISEPDTGIYDAMNKGIKASHGEIIGIINSDDWYEPCAVSEAAKMYEKTDFDMFYADLRMVSGDARRDQIQGMLDIKSEGSKDRIKKARCRWLATSRDWNHPTTFITRKVYERFQYKLESIHDDWDLVLRIRRAGYKIVVLNQVLADFRMGGVSNRRSLKESMKRFKARYRIYRNNGYSRWYVIECLMIETAKFLLA